MGITVLELVDWAIDANEYAGMDYKSASAIYLAATLKERLEKWDELDEETKTYIETYLPIVTEKLKAYAEREIGAAKAAQRNDVRKAWEEDKKAWDSERKLWERERRDLLERRKRNEVMSPHRLGAPPAAGLVLFPSKLRGHHMIMGGVRRSLVVLILSHATSLAVFLWLAVSHVR
jgi:hypothetical protein